ncbi:hypothetical protein QOZ84_11125 [Romboutsia sedimentorum]|uniref:Uncharacterized protein n=1 Tax=Romboutsia sedimentorum TaxID=1368474 RepID=A0ABT7EB06_9FIRM|nr:hypothetical protein [Romboutsia sedimentorum]MDK2564103.1 hypothetical protein [Romboutsia sedimentorum]
MSSERRQYENEVNFYKQEIKRINESVNKSELELKHTNEKLNLYLGKCELVNDMLCEWEERLKGIVGETSDQYPFKIWVSSFSTSEN